MALLPQLHAWLQALHNRLQAILTGRPRLLTGMVSGLALWVFLVGRLDRLVQLRRHRRTARPSGRARHRRHAPGDNALRFERAAGVHHLQGAAHRGAARADVAEPSEGGGLDRGPALLRASRRGRDPRRCRRIAERARRAPRRGRQHHHPAARAAKFSQRRQDLSAKAEGSHSCRQHREHLRQERHPRDLSEQGVPRRRVLRSRSRLARVLRQDRRNVERRRGSAARRLDSVAVEYGADRQHRPRDRAQERRAAGDGLRRGLSTRPRPNARSARVCG